MSTTTLAPAIAAATTTDVDALRTALARVKPAVGKVAPFSGVRIHGEGIEALTVSAHNPAMSGSRGILASGDPLDVVVDHADAVKALKAFRRGEVTLIGEPEGLRIRQGTRSALLRARPDAIVDPDPLRVSAGNMVALTDAEPFAAALTSVLPMVGKGAGRPILTMVCVDPLGEVAATDSYRLAIADVPFRTGDVPCAPLLVPGALMSAILPEMRTSKDVARIGTDGTRVTVEVGPEAWTAQLGVGQYPDYRRIVPALDWHATVDVADLSEAIKALRPMLRKTPKADPLRITFEPGGLVVEARSVSGSSVSERVGAEVSGPGEDVLLGVDPGYLLDALRAVRSDRCRIHFTGGRRPLLLSEMDRAPHVLALVMPIILAD